MIKECKHCWHREFNEALYDKGKDRFTPIGYKLHWICCHCGKKKVDIPRYFIKHGKYRPSTDTSSDTENWNIINGW